MSVTVGQVLTLLNRIAPFETAEPWDNVGLLAGSRDDRVDRVLCALDFSEAVLKEAQDAGAQMIVTHHPILFRGRKNLCRDDAEGKLLCELIQSGIALAAMHTNFDNAHPGVNDALAEMLELQEVSALESGMCMGLTEEISLGEFYRRAVRRLGGAVRMYGDAERKIRRVAVLGGAGEDFAGIARQAGADVYVTGEMSYHKALDALSEGICVLEAGHAATEKPAISLLSSALQNAANDVQYKLCVISSAQGLFL